MEKAIKDGADLKGADLEGAYLEGAYLEGADLKGAYLFIDNEKIDSELITKKLDLLKSLGIQAKLYVNKNIIPTRWNLFWEYGLIIDEYSYIIQTKEKQFKDMTTDEKLDYLYNKLNYKDE